VFAAELHGIAERRSLEPFDRHREAAVDQRLDAETHQIVVVDEQDLLRGCRLGDGLRCDGRTIGKRFWVGPEGAHDRRIDRSRSRRGRLW